MYFPHKNNFMKHNFAFIFSLVYIAYSCTSIPKNNPTYDELIANGKDLVMECEIDEAIASFKQALRIDQSRVEAYYGLGFSHMHLCPDGRRDREIAIRYFNKAVKIDPEFQRSYFNRAICKDELGDLQGALDDISKQIANDNTNADYYHNRAVYKLELGDTLGACDDFRKSFDLGSVIYNQHDLNSLCK